MSVGGSGGSSGGAKPWQLGDVQLRKVTVLERLADSDEQFVEDLSDLGVERDNMYVFLNDLERRGWVELQPRRIMSLAQAYPGARLTISGSELVEDLRQRRADVVERARAARTELLLWLYTAGTSMPVTTSVLTQDSPPTFYARPFTEDDVTYAARHLADAGLIRGPSAWGASGAPIRAALTSDGVTCVEDHYADPSEWARAAGGRTGANNFTFNNYGTTGPVAQGDQAQAIANHGPTAADIDALRLLLTTAVEAIEDADERDDLQTHVDDLIAALDPDNPDVEQVRKRANLLNRAAGRAGNAALQAATSEGTRRLVEWGINLI
jgi:hypothetical protein